MPKSTLSSEIAEHTLARRKNSWVLAHLEVLWTWAENMTEENDETVNLVRAFVARELRVRLEDVSLDSTLEWDLGLAGDDADGFFEAFITEFALDPDSFKTLDLGRHFGSEGMSVAGCCLIVVVGIVILSVGTFVRIPAVSYSVLIAVLLCFLAWFYVYLRKRFGTAIKVNDLVDAVRANRWLRTD